METISYNKETRANKVHTCNYCHAFIEKGSRYMDGVFKYEGNIYHWRTHKYCNLIADQLKMYDDCDEGVTDEDFREYIDIEYSKIMSEHFNEEYEDKDFKIPNFNDRLMFVLKYHKIEISK